MNKQKSAPSKKNERERNEQKMSNQNGKHESDMMLSLWSNLRGIHNQYEEGCRTFQETIFGMMAAMSEGFEYAQAEKVKDDIDEVAREMLGMPSHFEEWKNRVDASMNRDAIFRGIIANLHRISGMKISS